ncbi:LOW QUALITY PROTEIN: hypothetical protein SETIT_8G206600v2 [Setaria italica]|uniref:Uncharacterized protein n=1 Tax=Setaria italica TaxID=4555 RepID=A0A368S9W5_SETIT|nr:LOW QUALITY PROTEIN: hypothetical protein SETIT_8G206600v2 [Setaria italica]
MTQVPSPIFFLGYSSPIFFRLHRHACPADPSRRPYPIDALLSHGYSSAALRPATRALPRHRLQHDLLRALPRLHGIRSTDRADAVRALFRSYGFTDADITEIVRRASVVFTLDPDRILRPKFDLFASLGRGGSELILLTRSLDNHLVPCVQFLRGVLGTDVAVRDAISRTPRILHADLEKNMMPCAVLDSPTIHLEAHDVPDVVKAYEGNIKFQGFR